MPSLGLMLRLLSVVALACCDWYQVYFYPCPIQEDHWPPSQRLCSSVSRKETRDLQHNTNKCLGEMLTAQLEVPAC